MPTFSPQSQGMPLCPPEVQTSVFPVVGRTSAHLSFGEISPTTWTIIPGVPTIAGRTLNELYRESLFQLALTFHAGMAG